MDDLLFTLYAITIACIIGIAICAPEIEKQEETRKNIIEKTEKYEKYDNCEKIEDIWYCWNQ